MKIRFTEEQIIRALNEHEAGKKASDIVREYNISEQTFYRWKSKYGGMDVSEANRQTKRETNKSPNGLSRCLHAGNASAIEGCISC